MVPNSNEIEYQDIIIQEPELVLATLTEEQIAILKNPRYLNLIKIIHEKGSLSLAEMTEEYASQAKDDQAKSESTVYRYLTVLKEHNIVHEAGQRIFEGKTLSQTLYSLTYQFVIIYEPEIDWEGSYGWRIFKEIARILKIIYPNKPIDEEALFQWQLHFQRTVDADKQRLISSRNPEILEILSVWAPWSINDIMEAFGWLSVLIKVPSAQQDFLKCFDASSENKSASLSSRVDSIKKIAKVAYRDVIRQLPDIQFILPTNDPRRHYIENPAYIPLFHVLRDGSMTIEELVEKYNQVAPVSRTRSTIYRYVNTLKNAKLVIEVGQRVTPGKKATQKLYAPVARMIIFQDEQLLGWDSERNLWLLDSIIKILRFLYPELPKVNKKCFREFLIAVWQYIKVGLSKLSPTKNKDVFDLLHTYNWTEFYVAYTTFLDYDVYLNNPNLYEQLRQCLSG